MVNASTICSAHSIDGPFYIKYQSRYIKIHVRYRRFYHLDVYISSLICIVPKERKRGQNKSNIKLKVEE